MSPVRDIQTEHGRVLPATTSMMRPAAADELAAWGGARLFRHKRVLDVGTGDGRLALGVARWADSVVGVDPDPSAIRSARRNARSHDARNVRFRVAPAQKLPVADESVDVAILSWAL